MSLIQIPLLVLTLLLLVIVVYQLHRLKNKIRYKPHEMAEHLGRIEMRMARPHTGLTHDPDGDHWICIYTRDRLGLLRETIRSAREHEPSAKLLVIDNGSADETIDQLSKLVKEGTINRLVCNTPGSVPQWQKCFSIHQAVGILAPESVATITWLDDDTELEAPWLADTVGLLTQYPDVAMVNLLADPREDRHHPIIAQERLKGETVLLKKSFSGQSFVTPPDFFREFGLPPIREGINDASVEDWYYSRLIAASEKRIAVLDRAAHHGYDRSLRISVMHNDDTAS